MLSRLLPNTIDNTLRGLTVSAWLLAPILLMKFLMGANAAIITRSVAISADGLPLDTFGKAGEQAVLSLLSLWGLQQAAVALFGALVLLRYKSMIPLIYALLLVEQIGRKVLQLMHPMVAARPAGANLPIGVIVNSALLLALVIGFILSVIGFRYRRDST